MDSDTVGIRSRRSGSNVRTVRSSGLRASNNNGGVLVSERNV